MATILEKQSLRKKKAIIYLVDRGEYSLGYALLKVEELYDDGKLVDSDYEELTDYIENLMDKVEEEKVVVEEPIEEVIEEPIEETRPEEGEE